MQSFITWIQSYLKNALKHRKSSPITDNMYAITINGALRWQRLAFLSQPGLFNGWLVLCHMVLVLAVSSSAMALEYATRTDQVSWEVDASKFECRLSHAITDFGKAAFIRPAGESVQFRLYSNSPRMKSGQASLTARPPAWSANKIAQKLGFVNVRQGRQPIHIGQKLSERMLAELQQGTFLEFSRTPWYGNGASIKVLLSSIGFRESHNQYLACLANLLPVNFRQVEKTTLYYDPSDDTLTHKTKSQLEKIILYANADPSVKIFYIDGHTDSEGMRNKNLIVSQQRAEMIANYLIDNGVAPDRIVTRWHGERYPVISNRSAKGRAKNRRVTVRLSKKPKPKSIPVVKKEPVAQQEVPP